jgi:DNA-binding transcriptional LysR family regulator
LRLPSTRWRARACAGAGDHIQLVLTDRSQLTHGQDRGVIGTQTWRLADLGSKHMLLKEGIGWGFMPEPMVRKDIETGRLVRLDMREYKDGFMRLHAIYRRIHRPARGSWLIARSRLRRWGDRSPINVQPFA